MDLNASKAQENYLMTLSLSFKQRLRQMGNWFNRKISQRAVEAIKGCELKVQMGKWVENHGEYHLNPGRCRRQWKSGRARTASDVVTIDCLSSFNAFKCCLKQGTFTKLKHFHRRTYHHIITFFYIKLIILRNELTRDLTQSMYRRWLNVGGQHLRASSPKDITAKTTLRSFLVNT